MAGSRESTSSDSTVATSAPEDVDGSGQYDGGGPPDLPAGSGAWPLEHGSTSAAAAPAPPQVPPPPPLIQRRFDADNVLQSVPLAAPERATRGWWRKSLRLPPGRDELEERADAATVRGDFGRSVSFAVVNPKGSAGKTPVTIMLSSAFGSTRGGGVLAWDNNELRGTMNLRSESQGCGATVRDFLRAIPALDPHSVRRGDVSTYVRHQVAGQFDVLAATSTSYEAISREEFLAAHRVLSRFYPVIGVDTGNAESAANWIAAVETCDALVVPIKWRWDVCLPAIQMLDELEQYGEWAGELVQRVVVVASNGAADVDPATKARMLPYFEERAMALVEIPTDPHIAGAGPILYDHLATRTRRQSLRAAAAVARSIHSAPERNLP